MDFAGKRVLVTGADGFIGSHLAEALVRRGAVVRALVLYDSRGSLGWLDDSEPAVRESMEVVPGDVRDGEQMRGAAAGCEVVFHLAALIGIPYSYLAPRSYLDTNVTGTLNLLEAARAAGVARFVHTSTSEVYGSAVRVPIDEGHPLSAQSPYAASKIGADQMALAFHRSFGLPVTVVRPFNTYGPRQSLRAVIPTVIVQLLHGSGTVRLGSLDPTRDFNYVDDTVAGFLALAQAPLALGEVVNLGSGFEISIGAAAECIARIIGKPLVIEQGAERVRPDQSEVERLWADNGKASRLAGVAPEYAGLDGFRAGLERTVAWFQQPENLKKYPAGGYAR